MPYRIAYKPVKSGKNWVIVDKETGKVVGRSVSKEKAEASVRARLAGEHGWRRSKDADER